MAKEVSMERKKVCELTKTRSDKEKNNVQEMKSAFTHWANLEAARDDSSMNLKETPI